MATEQFAILLRLLRRRVGEEIAGGLSDRLLLERFISQRDEAAFETLFWRYGPMVLAVCRRLLPAADVEDAFQATFLVLVRKAASIARGDAIGAWLYRVAYRIALRARAGTRAMAELPAEGPPDDEESGAWRDLRPVLDEAIATLPEKYRAPVVLCYFEGKTNQEAAHELGCPKGTVAIRLKRAAQRLRRRLERCGLLLPAAVLGALLAGRTRVEAVESSLAQITLKAALGGAAGGTGIAAAAPHAVALAHGVIRAMFIRKLKLAVSVVLALAVLVGGGVWWYASPAEAAPPPARDQPAPTPAPSKGERRELADVATPVEGIVQSVASEITVKPGAKPPAGAFRQEVTLLITEVLPDEKGPGDNWIQLDRRWYRPLNRREEIRPNKVRLHRLEKWFLPLKEGTRVEAGQLLALTDPSLALDDVSIKLARLDAAEADRVASEKTREEARERWIRADGLWRKGAAPIEDVTAAKLGYDRCIYDTISKTEAVKVAARELRRTETVLDQHAIRSRVNGVVAKVYKHPGEGVKALEAVVQVRLDDK